MTEFSALVVSKRFYNDLLKMVAEFRKSAGKPKRDTSRLNGLRPPVKFITHVPYSTYTIRTYDALSYDADGDSRTGQEYAVMVDGETPIAVSLLQYDPDGNHKQRVTFVGDNIDGTVKLSLEGQETTAISLATSTLTEGYLTQKLEALSNVGLGNVKVSIWPGQWLIEFKGQLAGQTFDLMEIDIPEAAVFEVHIWETNWRDSGEDAEVHYPVPLVGTYDTDDGTVNDAVAAGSEGTAQWFPGVGWMADVNLCRDYNGDGTPEL